MIALADIEAVMHGGLESLLLWALLIAFIACILCGAVCLYEVSALCWCLVRNSTFRRRLRMKLRAVWLKLSRRRSNAGR